MDSNKERMIIQVHCKKAYRCEGQPPACQQMYGLMWWEVPMWWGSHLTYHPHPCEQTYWQTDMTENITFPQTTHVCGQQNALGVHPCGIPSFSLYFITNKKPNVIEGMTSLCTCYSDLCLWVLINLKFRRLDFMSLVTFI